MQTHRDGDAREWMRSLKKKADGMVERKESEITAGKEGEKPLAEWKSHEISIVHLLDDEHGILRISVGASEEPVESAYCNFRGDHNACCNLLRRALAAMEKGPR